MPCPEERPVSATRRRKEALLGQVCAQALAGQSCRQIAATCGVPKSTVSRWLEALREDCPTRLAGSAEMAADAVARYKTLYDEALEGYRRSQEDKATERVVETETARGPKKKRTVRRVNQVGKYAFLAAGRRAVDGMVKIVARVAPRPAKVEAPDQGPLPPEAAAKEASPKTSKNDLEAQCLAEIGRREKAAAAPQPESAVAPCDQGRDNLPEEKTLPERPEVNSADDRQWPGREETRSAKTGQAVATRMEDDIHSEERQPSVSAGFSTRQPRPVVESRCAVRGRPRRITSTRGFNRPILIAAARVGAAARASRSERHGTQLRKGVGGAVGDSG